MCASKFGSEQWGMKREREREIHGMRLGWDCKHTRIFVDAHEKSTR